jgi:hypothetical protein
VNSPDDADSEREAAAWSPSKKPPGEDAPPEPSAPLQLPLNPAFVERAKRTRQELNAASPNAGRDERLLHELVSEEIAIASALLEAEGQLSERLLLLIDNPKLLVHITKALKDVVHLRNSVTRRIEGALGVASNLRAQRRFLARSKKSSKTKGRVDGF